MYQTSRESRRCDCGGKSCAIPSVRTRHLETLKHRTWQWERLCEAMLAEGLTLADKVRLLRQSKAVLVL
jgi:hypothetical protein